MCVQDAADITAVLVHRRVHSDHAPWMGGRSPSRRVPSSATRTTADRAWLRSDGPAVKYISSAPGTGGSHSRARWPRSPACDNALGDFDYLIDQVLVHDALPQGLDGPNDSEQTLPVKQI